MNMPSPRPDDEILRAFGPVTKTMVDRIQRQAKTKRRRSKRRRQASVKQR